MEDLLTELKKNQRERCTIIKRLERLDTRDKFILESINKPEDLKRKRANEEITPRAVVISEFENISKKCVACQEIKAIDCFFRMYIKRSETGEEVRNTQIHNLCSLCRKSQNKKPKLSNEIK